MAAFWEVHTNLSPGSPLYIPFHPPDYIGYIPFLSSTEPDDRAGLDRHSPPNVNAGVKIHQWPE